MTHQVFTNTNYATQLFTTEPFNIAVLLAAAIAIRT